MFASRTQNLRALFNDFAHQGAPMRAAMDQQLEHSAPHEISAPYIAMRDGFKLAAFMWRNAEGSTKAAFIAGSVMGDIGLARDGLDYIAGVDIDLPLVGEHGTEMWVGAKLLQGASVAKFFLRDMKAKPTAVDSDSNAPYLN